MVPSGGDGLVGARRSVSLPVAVEAPAGDGVVGRDRTSVVFTGGDGLVGARRSVGPSEGSAAPAGDGVVGRDRAGVVRSGRDGLVGARRSVSLPIVVVSPAGDGVAGCQGTRKGPANGPADGNALVTTCRSINPRAFPATNVVVRCYGAGIIPSEGNHLVASWWRRRRKCPAPAGDGVVGSDRTSTYSDGNGVVGIRKRINPLVSPAGDGVVSRYGAGERAPGGDGLVGARRSVSLPIVVVSPAGDGVVGRDRTSVDSTGGDGLVGA